MKFKKHFIYRNPTMKKKETLGISSPSLTQPYHFLHDLLTHRHLKK